MEKTNILFSSKITEALGWTVLHSFWQSGLIAAFLLLSFVALKKSSAQVRYRVAGGALLTVLLSSVVTFFYFLTIEKGKYLNIFIAEGKSEVATPIVVDITESTSSIGFFSNYFEQHLPLIVAIWLVGMGFFLLRLIGGFAYVHYLKNNKIKAVTEYWQLKANALRKKIPVDKPVAIFESALVKIPITIGYLKPVILLPFGLINHLSLEQTEAILAHELAHIARKDYLFNILQSVMEVLFYFNPAVWLISNQIRRERENCCDDIAVRVCGNSLNYVKALVSVEEVSQQLPSLALAFSNNKNHLIMRVQRILKQPQKKSRLGEKLIASLFILTTFGLFAFQQKEAPNLDIVEIDSSIETAVNEPSKNKIIVFNQDTIPAGSSGRISIRKNVNGKEMLLETKDGKVEGLMIDNRVINPKHYGKYEQEIAQLLEESKNVPAPPAPPSLGDMSAPPAPPHPAGLDRIPPPPPAPPAPPTPPAPPRKNLKGNGTMTPREENRQAMREEMQADRAIRLAESSKKMAEQRQEMANQRKEMAENAAVIRQEMTEELALHRAALAEHQKAIVEQRKAMILQAEASQKQDIQVEKTNEQTVRIEGELKKDDLYNDGVYRFKLSNKELKINGKKQSKEMHEKYAKICAQETRDTGVDYSLEINRTKSGNQQTISVKDSQ